MGNTVHISENSINTGDTSITPVISARHFGINTLINTTDMLQPAVIEAMGNSGVMTMRYPGGTVAESLVDVTPYGEDVVVETSVTDQGNEIVTVSQFMDIARQIFEVTRFSPQITFVVPTSGAYSGPRPSAGTVRDGEFDDIRPIADGYVEDVVGYVRFAIQQAAANGVQIGQLEIGNEFFCPDGADMNGREYGNIAGRIIFALTQMMNSAEIQSLLGGTRPEITVQAVHHSCGNYYRDSDWANLNVLQGFVDAEAAQGQSLLGYINGITSHYHFEDSFDIVDTAGQAALTSIPGFWSGEDNLSRVVAYDNTADNSDTTWVISDAQATAARNLYSDFFSRFYAGYQTPSDRPLSIDVTEWSVQHPSGGGYYGLSQAAMMVELFYEMLTHGVTTASFWRMMNINPRWVGGGLIDRSDLSATGEARLTIPGVMFGLMSDSLIGLRADFDLEYQGSPQTNDVGLNLDIHGFTQRSQDDGSIERLIMFASNRNETNSDATQIEIPSGDSSENWYFVVNTLLGDGDADGQTMDATPVISYGNGYTSTDSTVDLYQMDGWGIQRIEVVTINDDANYISGRSGDDTILGLGGDDTISGADGNDSIKGQAGKDLLFGGNGCDTISGGWGADAIYGENGNDLIYGGGDNDALGGGAGDDFIFGDDGNDTIWSGADDDVADGGFGNDAIYGDAGNDTLIGNYGTDTVIGGDGDDVLTGQAWSDMLYGGAGSDFINGGFGHDRVNGGAGADRFYHQGIEGHGSDWIQDYSFADGDVLIFGGSAARDDFQVNFVETANAGVAEVEEAFIIYRPTGQILWALIDGIEQPGINLMIGNAVYDLLV